jgi:hypothetical protein
MTKKKQRTVASCFECAGLANCYHTKNPHITREEGRKTAAFCQSLRKGVTTETVQVEGRERGMSRKKAEKLVIRQRAVWCGPGRIRLNGQQA